MYGCESWTIKKAERQRIDAFKLWCWRRCLKVRWTARRSKQSTLREINPEYSLDRLMLKLKLQYFGHLMRKDNSLQKSLMLGKTEAWRRRGCLTMRWLDGITNAMSMNLGKPWEMVRDRKAWRAVVHGVTKSQTQPGDWTTTTLSERGTWHGSNVLSPESTEHTLFLFLLHCPEFPLRAIYWISCDSSPLRLVFQWF